MCSRGLPSPFTAAEERLLPLLATSLSLAEIAALLDVSRDEIERQAVTIYRKLDVQAPDDAS